MARVREKQSHGPRVPPAGCVPARVGATLRREPLAPGAGRLSFSGSLRLGPLGLAGDPCRAHSELCLEVSAPFYPGEAVGELKIGVLTTRPFIFCI